MAARNAASVFPEPVGAATSVWRPARIDGQARAWGSVGDAKLFSNQLETAGWNSLRLIREVDHTEAGAVKGVTREVDHQGGSL